MRLFLWNNSVCDNVLKRAHVRLTSTLCEVRPKEAEEAMKPIGARQFVDEVNRIVNTGNALRPITPVGQRGV